MKQLIHFHERNIRAGKKQMLHFTTLQETDRCGAVKYFAKYSLTAVPLTLPLVPTGSTLGENYIMRSLMICTPNLMLFGWSNGEEQVGGACSAHGG